MGMTIYGRTQPLARYPILKCLEVLKALGFAGVEVCLEHPDLAPATLSEDLALRVREKLLELGLSYSVSYHRNYVHDDVLLEETKKALRMAPVFGATTFVFGGTGRRGTGDDWKLMIERTRELVRIAEDVGVVLGEEFEPNFIVGSTEDLHRLFSDIPSGSLQANLDLGHVFLCDPDPMAAIAGLEGRIVHGHIENMATGVHCHLPPWKGDMDLGVYIDALDRAGFAGPLALDLYNEDYEVVGKKAVAFLQGLLRDHQH